MAAVKTQLLLLLVNAFYSNNLVDYWSDSRFNPKADFPGLPVWDISETIQ